MNPLISVIIPIYNREKSLPRCLDSVLSQTYRNIEIICVNDASTDGTANLLEDYQKRDSRIKVYTHKINKNAGGARNTAISNAKGEYLYFIDSDDWINATAIEDVVSASENSKYDVILTGCTVWEENGTNHIETIYEESIDRAHLIECGFLKGVRMLGGGYKRSLFVSNNVEFPENVYYEDNSICILPLLLATSIKNTNLYSYNYDANDNNSSSRKIDEKHIQDRIMTCNMLIENIKRYGFYERYKELADFNYIRLHLNTILGLLAVGNPGIIEYKAARHINKTVTICLPNKWLNQIPDNRRCIIEHPIKYLTKVKCKYILSRVHSIRHFIVVKIKLLIGMNPNKSIFE